MADDPKGSQEPIPHEDGASEPQGLLESKYLPAAGDEFDPDPYGVYRAYADLKVQQPGSLRRVYEGLLRSVRAGEVVENEVIQGLLEEMGPPKQTDKQRQQIDLLRFVETVRGFFNVPALDDASQGLIESPAFSTAVAKAHAVLCLRDPTTLNQVERYFVEQRLEHATDHLKKIRSRMK